MKIAYFDCFSGVSGDMILGALLDAGLALEDLNREIAKLGVQDIAIEREATARHAIAATRAKVCVAGVPLADAEHHLDLSGEPTHDHPHAHLKDITSRIADSRLDGVVKERSIRVFERLCAAEAEVHNAAPTEVALHEVGALDALIDVVGSRGRSPALGGRRGLRFAPALWHGFCALRARGAIRCRCLGSWPSAATCRPNRPISAPNWSPRPERRSSPPWPIPLVRSRPSATGRRLWRGPPRLRRHPQSLAPALGRARSGQRARPADRSQYRRYEPRGVRLSL